MQVTPIATQTGYKTLIEASADLPRVNGKRIHIQTLIRWITRGIKGVRLQAKKIGDRWFTTNEWLKEFEEQRTKASLGVDFVNPAQVDRDTAHALRELSRRYGIHVKGQGGQEGSSRCISHRGARRRS